MMNEKNMVKRKKMMNEKTMMNENDDERQKLVNIVLKAKIR